MAVWPPGRLTPHARTSFPGNRMTPSPHFEPDGDDLAPAAWNSFHAFLWSLSGAVVLGGSAALGLALRGGPFDGPLIPPWEALGMGAGFGLAAALFVSVTCGRSAHATAVLSGIACVTGGGCGVFATAFSEQTGSLSTIDFLAAFPLVGLLAGFAGYAGARQFAVVPPADDYSPRAVLPSRGLSVAFVALLLVVAAIIGSPSSVGWLVVSVAGLALVVASALIGQERRIAELERRIRHVEKGSPREDGEGSPSELD